MKIIGHRGAAGLALENSLASLQAALQYDVDAIEFDVRLTADNQLVLMHDSHTGRVADKPLVVRHSTLADLKKIKLNNGQSIPTLDEAIHALKTAERIIIEIKDQGAAREIIRIVQKYPQANIGFCSFQHTELAHIREALPHARIYTSEHFNPIEIIQHARKLHANGMLLNKWLVNPLTYRLAKRYGLNLAIYTVDSRFLQRFFQRLYPDAVIFTNHPERFVKKRTR